MHYVHEHWVANPMHSHADALMPRHPAACARCSQVIRFHFGLAAAHYTAALQQGSTELRVFAVDQFLHASTVNGRVQFVGPTNTATVVKPDIELCNSVLHVVDTVIVPAGYEHVLTGASKPAAATIEL